MPQSNPASGSVDQVMGNPLDGPDFPVVGIGASAGGLSAIQQFLEHLPADVGMAFVVVLHLSPRHESSADRILQRSTRLRVVQVKERTLIQQGHVYVISPRLALKMEDGHLCVSPGKRKDGVHIAIDTFFRTLGNVHRHRAFAIVLSGTGSDGVLGIGQVKEQGGVTFAQLPADSEYDDMPRNAIASGHIDFVLPVADMPQKLIDIYRNARQIELPSPESLRAARVAESPNLANDENALYQIIDLLAERTGHDFSHYKRATMLRRMERRLQVRMLKGLPEYHEYLLEHVDETEPLLDDMLINVTNFFRDREAFEALEREVVPALLEAAGDKEEIRIWVPGCATGEEAYSLAMLLDEARGEKLTPRFQIFATDIDAKAITVARRASYPGSILTDVPPTRLRSYFVQENGYYRIKKPLRERVLFAAHNVLSDPPFSRLDLVSCRNLLIYLNRDVQQKLLELFHFSLRDGGYLFLGSSESADAAGDLFHTFDKRHRIFRSTSKGSHRRRSRQIDYRATGATTLAGPQQAQERSEAARISDLHRNALEQFAPPSVVVDKDGEVVHMSEQAGSYLQHPAGQPSHSLPAIVESSLRLDLRGALFQALQSGKVVETRPLTMSSGRIVQIVARPFFEQREGAPYVLVLFRDLASGQDDAAPPAVPPYADNALVGQLENELQSTRRQLQATIEMSDTSGEELKASNEELQAINEELRSTTEELESSKEELQSVNEELITVNSELKAKVDETEKAHDDLKNFIEASDIATIFVDSELRIKRFTPRSDAIFSIIPSDIGRPLSDLTHRLNFPSMAQDTADVLRTLQTVEREVRSSAGHRYAAAIRPYQTASRQVDGAVLTFVDVTKLRSVEDQLANGEQDMFLALLQSNDFAVIAIGETGTVTGWNKGAQTIFGYQESEIVGRTIHVLFTPEDIAAGKPEDEMRTTDKEGHAEDERWHMRKTGERVFCSGVMTRLEVPERTGYVKIVRDITRQAELRQRQRELVDQARQGRDEARAAVALKDDFLAVVSHELKHPLNLISINSEILSRLSGSQRDEEPGQRALDAISRAIRSQGRIIDDLLDLSRVRTGKLSLDLTAVDLVAVTERCVETTAADSAAIELQIDFVPGEPSVVVCADSNRVHQIVWNLMSNAIKFTPSGGRIGVAVCREGRYGRLDVTDSGQGIESSFLPHVFEMFGQAQARAASRQTGLGIGLALVRQIVEHHEGRIEVKSGGLGDGSRFSVWLPLYQARRHAVPEASEPPREQSLAGLDMVLVDDDPLTVRSLQILLQMEGAHVRVATSVDDALVVVREQVPDLVITDLGMPERDGYSLLEALKADPRTLSIPVIALTGFGRENDVSRALAAGFAAHISKPVSLHELIGLIPSVRQQASEDGSHDG